MAEHDHHEALRKVRHFFRVDKVPKPFRKIFVGIIGGICFCAGIIMIFTPGPAFVFIPLGLLLLASEFQWAERWAHRFLDWMHGVRDKWRQRKARK